MKNKCVICSHPNRINIDREIVKGANLSELARNFGVSYNSVWEHSRQHVARQMVQAFEKKSLEENFDLLGKIDRIISRAEDIFLRNYKKGADITALKALDSQRNTIELLAKISYSLHQAKVAEIELKRMEQGDDQFEEQEKYQQNLSILTMPELRLYQKLVDKIEKQDHKMDILSFYGLVPLDVTNDFSFPIHKDINGNESITPKVIRTTKPKEKSYNIDLESLQVSELNTTIDLTPPKKAYQPLLKRK